MSLLICCMIKKHGDLVSEIIFSTISIIFPAKNHRSSARKTGISIFFEIDITFRSEFTHATEKNYIFVSLFIFIPFI